MTVQPGLVARFVGLLADPTRMAMCLALIDGRAWTAGELARHVGVGASTASEHLTALVAGDVLTEHRQGRHRYLRLAGPQMAQVIEDLVALAGEPLPTPQSLRATRVAAEMEFARTCYDHLAGALGVALLGCLVRRGLVSTATGVSLTPAGQVWLASLDPAVDLAHTTRPVVRTCLDWTERRAHLGGLAGAVMRAQFVSRGWIVQLPRERVVRVTPAGAVGLYDALGLDVQALRAVVT